MTNELSDVEWCLLDLLARAREKGMPRVNRSELLHSAELPMRVRAQLVFAGLTLPTELVELHNSDREFSITDKGMALHKFRFGESSSVAETVIFLPDRSTERAQ